MRDLTDGCHLAPYTSVTVPEEIWHSSHGSGDPQNRFRKYEYLMQILAIPPKQRHQWHSVFLAYIPMHDEAKDPFWDRKLFGNVCIGSRSVMSNTKAHLPLLKSVISLNHDSSSFISMTSSAERFQTRTGYDFIYRWETTSRQSSNVYIRHWN